MCVRIHVYIHIYVYAHLYTFDVETHEVGV